MKLSPLPHLRLAYTTRNFETFHGIKTFLTMKSTWRRIDAALELTRDRLCSSSVLEVIRFAKA